MAATAPRGQPPPGHRALTFLGGGVLVLAVAGGAWVLFGRGSDKKVTNVAGPAVPTATTPPPVAGPVVPGKTPAAISPTSTKPVAATVKPTAAATHASTPAPTAAATTKAPVATVSVPTPTASPATAKPTTPPTKPVTVAKPPVVKPQVGGTVAKKAYTFRVARGDTLWDFTKSTLTATGRSTSNANVTAFVARLYAANKATIGSNPNLIYRGETIVWPAGL